MKSNNQTPIKSKPIFKPLPANIRTLRSVYPMETISFNDWMQHIFNQLNKKQTR